MNSKTITSIAMHGGYLCIQNGNITIESFLYMASDLDVSIDVDLFPYNLQLISRLDISH